jgi:gentisate 1,2-dioxygenase
MAVMKVKAPSTSEQTGTPLDALHDELAAANFLPVWKYAPKLAGRQPGPKYRPFLWQWRTLYPFLMRARDLVDSEAGGERRAINEFHPDLRATHSTSHTLATAVQLVRAGEVAPAHRHTASAIRLFLQGAGHEIYTAVQGESFRMEDNDLVLTPHWTWHHHANPSAKDIIWLDGLDYPIINFLRNSFYEDYPGPGEVAPITRATNHTARRVGLIRPAWDRLERKDVVRYAWADAWATLDSLRGETGTPHDGILLEYANPHDSGPTLPTMGCSVQLLRPSERTQAHRATSSTVYLVVAGEGATVVDGQRLAWSEKDIFVVPQWAWHEHENALKSDAILFSITDRPLLDTLGLYREETLDSGGGHQDVTSAFEPGSA